MNNSTLEVFHSFRELPSHWKEFLYSQKHPFLHFHFWKSLEESESIGKHAGWSPRIFTHKEALAIGFLKTHSYGEYIFDWDWARAYEDYGLKYYPKLIFALPFTPVQASKILGKKTDKQELLKLISQWQEQNVTGTHFLFTNQDNEKDFQTFDYKQRYSFQYHWKNPGAKNFDDFLSYLKKSKRKNIKKEREKIQSSSLTISRLTADQIQSEHAKEIYEFYLRTSDKKWGHPYLTFEFFEQIFNLHQNNILYVQAKELDEPIAGALFFFDDQTLYGRYWGTKKETECLHFELCYYQGIEFCLERNIPFFEAGAQGEHKIPRGFLPKIIHSQHLINSDLFKPPIENFIDREKEHIENLVERLKEMSPFKNTND